MGAACHFLPWPGAPDAVENSTGGRDFAQGATGALAIWATNAEAPDNWASVDVYVFY